MTQCQIHHVNSQFRSITRHFSQFTANSLETLPRVRIQKVVLPPACAYAAMRGAWALGPPPRCFILRMMIVL